MLDANELGCALAHRVAASSDVITVLWCSVAGDRDAYKCALMRATCAIRMACIVVRTDGFQNPNSISSDLFRLFDENRADFETPQFGNHPSGTPMFVILLGRSALQVSQVSSPCALPDWFPEIGGRTIPLFIDDITFTASAPIGAPSARIPELCAGLFECEAALTRRLRVISLRDQLACTQLLELMRDKKRSPNESFADILAGAERRRKEIRNPDGFRPSAGDGQFILGRCLRIVTSQSPDALTSCGVALGTALEIGDAATPQVRDSLVAVMLRPTARVPGTARFGRMTLISIYCASQIITAAAHSDDYPSFPLVLVQQMSMDLRRTLGEIADAINRLA